MFFPTRQSVSRGRGAPKLLGPRKGLAVHFGHESWNMVLNMMIGIRLAVGRASFEIDRPLQSIDFNVKDKFSIVPQLTNFLDSKISSKVFVTRFIDYAPLVFRKLREEISGITEDDYLRSVGPEQLFGNMVLGNLSSLAELTTEGKGGAFFYYTADSRFMIKTVSRDEKRLLKSILRDYYNHLKANPHSLIVRFYGLHGLRVKMNPILFQQGKYRHDEQIYFVVMGNLFNTPLEVNRRYDLKGSYIGRRTADNGDPTVALKDNNFIDKGERLLVGPEMKQRLSAQIWRDVKFFASHNILDYSLLVGIHEAKNEMMGSAVSGDVRIPTNGRDCPLNPIVAQDGSCVYYVGIIDILSQWNTIKKMENFFKSIRYPRDGISSVPPEVYANRFARFMDSILK
jgi:hypothetical protein